MTKHDFEWDFVISYAGEDTAYAEQLKSKLTDENAKVFFAPDNLAQTWGQNLVEFLADIYSKKGLFCISLVSEHYVNKQWTRHEWRSAQERALKDVDTAYLLPIRLDDTKLPGLLETTGYIDAQTISIDDIVSIALEKLRLHIENVQIEKPRKRKPDDVWQYVPECNQRNKFLRENNYLNRKSSDFAQNEWTKRLYSKRENSFVDRFFTLFAIPIPDAQFFETEEIINSLKLQAGQICSETPPKFAWQIFNIGQMRYSLSGQSEYVRYHYHDNTSEILATSFLRFDEDGAIEYADGYHLGYFHEQIQVYAYDFIDILGSVWKFLIMTSTIYSRLGYIGKFQVGVNLVNTEGTTICNFADERKSSKKWLARCDNSFRTMYDDDRKQGIAFDKNLQFIFDINPLASNNWWEDIEGCINQLSQKIQRIYNLSPKARHLSPDSQQFPWWRFGNYSV